MGALLSQAARRCCRLRVRATVAQSLRRWGSLVDQAASPDRSKLRLATLQPLAAVQVAWVEPGSRASLELLEQSSPQLEAAELAGARAKPAQAVRACRPAATT